ncbi:MAG: twin-arginine translocation signal domain-containing protein [Bacteroidetes bacterium]|nr:twin-arginine translocation signal domain-containing protein [Bacteroidota bacterium]
MEKKRQFTRRDFVQKTAIGAAGLAILPTILPSCKDRKPANSRINIAHIGVGDRGTAELVYYLLPLKDCKYFCM